MPRFSVAFARRKSTADDIEHAEVAPAGQSSFRVLERHDYSGVKSFDGGAKMARASGPLLSKPDLQADDNIFSDMKGNRGSGLSNTTHTTSTDTSSRHSNASTAPSSADFSGGNLFHDDNRPPKSSSSDMHGRGGANKSIGSKFLDKAGRTFSFGGQKKYTIPPPPEDPPLPDLRLPMPMAESGRAGSRGTTTYAQAPTVPAVPSAPTITRKPAPRRPDVLDVGSDFASMFSGSAFEKRASMATLKNDDLASPRLLTGNPQAQQPTPHSPDNTTQAEPLLGSWNTPQSKVVDDYSSDKSSPTYDSPPRVPNHSSPRYHSPPRQAPARSSPPAEQPPAHQAPPSPDESPDDEDAQLLAETYTAIQLLSAEDDEFEDNPQQGRYRREEDNFTVAPRQPKPAANPNNARNGDSGPRRYVGPQDGAPRNKVMTPAEFEKYREDKIRHDRTNSTSKDDDEDDINYEDDEDEAEKSKQQAKQRRKQEAHMAVYRQQMMKVTGETNPTNGLGIPASLSAPQLGHVRASSLDPAAAPPPPLPATANGASGGSDEADDDEEIPLAILQAHGFPNKNRPPTRLSMMGSNPNIRASAMLAPGRPSSAMGESAAASRRHSTLPAFARNLPQDPFIGASIAQPALRESLSFNEMGMGPKPPSPLPPGGLVGVIASEERQRAMRRGSPSVDPSRLMGSGYNTPPGMDHMAGIPPNMMYPQGQMGGAMPGMVPGMMQPPMQPPMQSPMLTPGDQAQLQMTQQMSQFMQMQMQFMQLMAANQNGGMPQQQAPFQQPYGGLMGNQSMVDLSSRNSVVGEQTLEPRRGDYGSMRTMSMVQPSSAPMAHPGYAGSIRSSIHGYTPSIAPSERSNIGLPNRYRPVSQAINHGPLGHMQSQSFSGALSAFTDNKTKTSMRIVSKSASDDDDDEEGWEAMKNKREKKRSLWRSKKNLSSVI